MYSNLKSVQYLIVMLKKKNIRNVVISAGTSHDAIVRSLENDSFFNTYNIVDERSACFFALGLIQEIKEPVAICCTSGTASVNYLSGVIEASHRNMPLIVITADKNPYYLNQQEDQMINQKDLFNGNVKYSVTLPMIKDSKDEWYCKRLLNEVFLEYNHHGNGPVHINIPIEEGMFAIDDWFTETTLPNIELMERIDETSSDLLWQNKFLSLKNKKVLIICGQDYNFDDSVIKNIESIFKKYNCIFSVEKISNLHCDGTLETARAALIKKNNASLSNLIPDVVITLFGNVAWDGKFLLKGCKNKFEHWVINSDGTVQDYYKNFPTIFECSTEFFLEKMALLDVDDSNEYYNEWKKVNDTFKLPEFDYSNLYVTKELMRKIPKNSILNLGNSSTIRLAQFFDNDPSIKIYCNRGIHGIDGCVSTFIGQSAVTDKLSFLIVGDLTFFYDMNSLWNRYLGKNIRIMLVNNSGAALFHFNQGLDKFPTLNENVAADHNANAKGWAESRGFKYLSVTSKEGFDATIDEFISESDKPIILEVFTKKEEDAKFQHEFFKTNSNITFELKKNVKKAIKKAIGRK